MRPQILNYFFVSVDKVKGIGPKLQSLLANLLIKRDFHRNIVVKDLIFHTPINIITRIKNPDISPNIKDRNVILKLQVEEVESIPKWNKNIYRIHCTQNAKPIDIVYFNVDHRYIKSQFQIGKNIAVAGIAERYLDRFQIIHPKYIMPANDIDKIPESEPVYPLTAGISSKIMHKIINSCLTQLPEFTEWLDESFKKQNKWLDFKDTISKIHNPKSSADVLLESPYRLRLAYDELLASQLAMALTRRNITKQKGNSQTSPNELARNFLKVLGFKLTENQKEILKEIFSDMESENRMFRLIQGDVGSGKTVLAILAMIKSVESGYQAAFMAPTEILAKQQYEWLLSVIEKNDISAYLSVTLLSGSTKENIRKQILPEIESGKINIVIGTHALFQDRVIFKKLGLIIIDEQHRFGVRQRMQFSDKGQKTDILLMSATPIPRTLSMTLYGDMEISLLKEKPAGRQKIETRMISTNKIEDVISGITRTIEDDNQVYWVCPLVSKLEEEFADEKEKIISVEERFEYLQKKFGSKVGIVHGKMKSEDKNKAIADFLNKKTKILVATTVIEVGVNIPNATIMIIENAEKFGLAQLHQLRGRVGRGAKKSNCILLYGNSSGENSIKRLNVLRETDDGFKIAEEDMALRGIGDLLGTKQSGFPEYDLAELPAHKELLFAARDDVKMILEKDPELKSERGQALRTLLYLFEYDQQIKLLAA